MLYASQRLYWLKKIKRIYRIALLVEPTYRDSPRCEGKRKAPHKKFFIIIFRMMWHCKQCDNPRVSREGLGRGCRYESEKSCPILSLFCSHLKRKRHPEKFAVSKPSEVWILARWRSNNSGIYSRVKPCGRKLHILRSFSMFLTLRLYRFTL